MKQIKFRVWDVRRKCMVYLKRLSIEEYVDQYEQCIALIFGKSVHSDFAELASREDYVIMQYIGLKDKNSKEIYEDDIVKISRKNAYGDEGKIIGVVTYIPDELGYALKNCIVWQPSGRIERWDKTYFFKEELKNIEVIGNIYENSNLLEEG